MKKLIIAIDGYSSSGKSTMARDLARRIGYVYVDSGAMYRAVTLYAIEHGMASPEKGVDTKALIAASNTRFSTDAMWKKRSGTCRSVHWSAR